MRVSRPWVLNAGLAIGSFFLAFAAGEVAARLWLAGLARPEQRDFYRVIPSEGDETLRWTRHHYLNYVPRPGYHKGRLHHNRLGYRGAEISREKPPGVVRVVLLGGSSTYESEVEDDRLTSFSLMERFLKDAGYGHVQVVCGGVAGYDSWESLINLEFRVLDLAPDVVMVYHGTNDVHARMVQPATYRGDNAGRRKPWSAAKTPWWEQSCLLRCLSRRLGWTRQQGLDDFVVASTSRTGPLGPDSAIGGDPMAVLEQNPPVYFRRNLANMAAVARQNRCSIVFVTWAHSPEFPDYASTPHYARGFAQHNAVVRQASRELGVSLFDFAKLMPADRRYWADGRHCNEAGNRRKARLFADYLIQSGLIENRQGRERADRHALTDAEVPPQGSGWQPDEDRIR